MEISHEDNVHYNEESQAIVKAILTYADTLGLQVIAQGVEHQEQLDVLNQDGCNQAQGFIFSKPLSSSKFENLLLQPKGTDLLHHINV